jgi:type IV secretion system protein VirD4
LITADEIMRFPQGKCVITNPAYGNQNEALFPYKLTIPISSEDRKRADSSEQLWSDTICTQLIERQRKIEQKFRSFFEQDNNSKERDYITWSLQRRIESAFKLLPLPEEEQSSDRHGNQTDELLSSETETNFLRESKQFKELIKKNCLNIKAQ